MRQKPVAELGDGNNAPMMSVGLAMPESIRRNGHSKFEETVKPPTNRATEAFGFGTLSFIDPKAENDFIRNLC
jgi:hypothetical protein